MRHKASLPGPADEFVLWTTIGGCRECDRPVWLVPPALPSGRRPLDIPSSPWS